MKTNTRLPSRYGRKEK